VFAALAVAACSRGAEPRRLIEALPGEYPEVVYFVPTGLCAVALTIDDGPDAQTTPALLDALRAHGATATFFLIGSRIAGNEKLVTRMLAEGHEIGHHMMEDRRTFLLPDDDLRRRFDEAAALLEDFGDIQWFRPGSGLYNDTVLALTRERGYRIALASVFPMDTLVASPETMSAYIENAIEPGSVVVLHDFGARGRRTADTLERLLPALARRGYGVTSLGGLERANRDPDAAPWGRRPCGAPAPGS
jgi:peptidoglycan/xylan/chitin deacetylase (PgdA/CDA1 family)